MGLVAPPLYPSVLPALPSPVTQSNNCMNPVWKFSVRGSVSDFRQVDQSGLKPTRTEMQLVNRLSTVQLPQLCVRGIPIKQSSSPLMSNANIYDLTFFPDSQRRSDLEQISQEYLYLSKCPAYYPDCNLDRAHALLKPAAVGTYLIRKSSVPNVLVTLSTKTKRGVTSIRVQGSVGDFHLDTSDDAHKMLHFTNVLKLVQYYMHESHTKTHKNVPRFVEENGRKDIPVLLKKPYVTKVSSLKDLCRKTVNKHSTSKKLDQWLQFQQPELEKYMREYPFYV